VKAGYGPEPAQLGVFAAAALLASWLLTRRRAGSSVEASGTAAAPHQTSRRHDLLLISVNGLVAFAALGHWHAARLPLMLPLLSGAEAVKRHQALQDPATGGNSQTRGALSRHQPG
jgi:hypothetical protein